MKDHGICTQARCRVRGWELHESDMQMLQENTDPEVILQNMPKRIFVEMELKNFPRYDDLPEHWVPVPPTTTEWYLDKAQATSSVKAYICGKAQNLFFHASVLFLIRKRFVLEHIT